MRINRHITHHHSDPFAGLQWKRVDVEICHADPAKRCCLTDIEVPAHWSYAAAETLVRFYIRRAGVPAALTVVKEKEIPQWLWRHVPDDAALLSKDEKERYGAETSARQVFHRMAGAWTYAGFKAGYFDTEADARTFYDECCAMLARQLVAPNSPQWFNTGLHWAYGLTGPAQGHFHVDLESKQLRLSENAYEYPQLSACFLNGVRDDLVNEGGIVDLLQREARVFKYGSASGSNMSAIRGAGEHLSTGGGAIGLMRFLAMGEKAAGAIHSGGLPRRAGKMVVVDVDHPEIMQFIRWKAEEQYRAAAMIAGARVMRQHLAEIMQATQQAHGEARFNLALNPLLNEAVNNARRAHVPTNAIERALSYAKQGFKELYIPLYSAEGESDVFFTVGAHQSRQAVRVTDRFMRAARSNESHSLRRRTDLSVSERTRAREVLEELAHSAWSTGDPAILFADHVRAAHTCPESGEITATTPGTEYQFLEDTACPLAAINLTACANEKGVVDIPLLVHVAGIASVMLDISVSLAQYPSREMARRTHTFRPIGLGVTNASPLIMRMGYAYDSDEARATLAALVGIVTGEAYGSSAELAREFGAFEAFGQNRKAMMAQLAKQRSIADAHAPQFVHWEALPQPELLEALRKHWAMAIMKGEAYGYRNAHVSCVPPTSTITRVMDSEAMGIAPMTELVRTQPQRGGIARPALTASLAHGLSALGYSASQVRDIEHYVMGWRSLQKAPHINTDTLAERGLSAAQIAQVEGTLNDTGDLREAFDPWLLGERFCRDQLKLTDLQMFDNRVCLLECMGFSAEEIRDAAQHVGGHGHLEGAPHIRPEDIAVFTCCTKQTDAQSVIGATAQLRMMAAVQPFISGGIAHTVTLDHHTSLEVVRELIFAAWSFGLKSLNLDREGCALYLDQALEAEVPHEDEDMLREAGLGYASEHVTPLVIVKH